MRRQLYEVQRAMRSRRETALRRGVIAVLDIGTTKVACLVLQFVPEEVGEGVETRPVLRQGAFRVIGAANTRSRGIELGEIAAMDECERAIRTAIQGAQKMANLRVDHVIVELLRRAAALLRGRGRDRGGLLKSKALQHRGRSTFATDRGHPWKVLLGRDTAEARRRLSVTDGVHDLHDVVGKHFGHPQKVRLFHEHSRK